MNNVTYWKFASEITRYFPELGVLTEKDALSDIERQGFANREWGCSSEQDSLHLKVFPSSIEEGSCGMVVTEAVYMSSTGKRYSATTERNMKPYPDEGGISSSQVSVLIFDVSRVLKDLYDSLSEPLQKSVLGKVLEKMWYIRDKERSFSMPDRIRRFVDALYEAYGMTLKKYHDYNDKFGTRVFNVFREYSKGFGAGMRFIYAEDYILLHSVYAVTSKKVSFTYKGKEKNIPQVNIICNNTYFRPMERYNFRPIGVYLNLLIQKAEERYSRGGRQTLDFLEWIKTVPRWNVRKEPLSVPARGITFSSMKLKDFVRHLSGYIQVVDYATGEIYLDVSPITSDLSVGDKDVVSVEIVVSKDKGSYLRICV